MQLTWLQAKQILAKWADRGGLCPTDPRVPLFVRQVLDYLLISGSYGNLRKFCFCAVKGCFTIPYELETPLKVKIEDRVGTVWDKWLEFHAVKDFDENCYPAGRTLREEPNYFPTVYDVPAGGARVAVMGTCDEAEDAHVIIKGVDPTGREIITTHNGVQVVGEYLRIKKGDIRYTQCVFAQITEVFKTKTNGYTTLLWVDPAQGYKGFLADYSPLETLPQYRRFRLTTPKCDERVKVSVFGRIRLKAEYTDTDLIPFDNILALNTAGQTINAVNNQQLDVAAAGDKLTTTIIDRENSFKQVNTGQPMEMFIPLSGGSIKNII